MESSHRDLTKEEALEELSVIWTRIRTSNGFYVPFNIVAALLDKPQVMRTANGRMLYRESKE